MSLVCSVLQQISLLSSKVFGINCRSSNVERTKRANCVIKLENAFLV